MLPALSSIEQRSSTDFWLSAEASLRKDSHLTGRPDSDVSQTLSHSVTRLNVVSHLLLALSPYKPLHS